MTRHNPNQSTESASAPCPTDQNKKCLVLACGNPLRSDDGLAYHLAQFAEDLIAVGNLPARVIARMQWTPDLAEDIANSHSVIFLDCSTDSTPGEVSLRTVVATPSPHQPSSHHLHAQELLAVARDLYSRTPTHAFLLTIGAENLNLGETLSLTVRSALPIAHEKLKEAFRVCIAL